MNIKEKLTLSVGVLVSLIIGLVAFSVISLQILTATEPTSPVADYGLTRALTLLLLFGALSITIGFWMLVKLPNSINRPFQELTKGINEIANHNYDVTLNLTDSMAMEQLSSNFNRMARRLRDYHNSSISQLRVSKQYIETLINSIDEPIICMDQQRTLYFINNEALDILNLKREEVLGKPAQEIAMRNDLLRRLLVGMGESKEADSDEKKSAPLKIYADNKESYFQVKYLPVRMKGNESDHWCRATRRASRTALCAGFRSRHRSPLPREHLRALFPCAGH